MDKEKKTKDWKRMKEKYHLNPVGLKKEQFVANINHLTRILVYLKFKKEALKSEIYYDAKTARYTCSALNWLVNHNLVIKFPVSNKTCYKLNYFKLEKYDKKENMD